MKERLIRWLLAVLGNKIDWTDEAFKANHQLIEQLLSRLEVVERRADLCEQRHEARDAADAQRDAELARLRADVEKCGREHETVAQQLKQLENRRPNGMRG